MYALSLLFVSLCCQEGEPAAAGAVYRGSTPTGSSSVQTPDISAVVTGESLLMREDHDPARNRVRISELELAVQGYVYPGIRTDIIAAFEQDYEREDGRVASETHVHLEEAFLSVGTLPWGLDRYLTLQAGRKFLSAGRINQLHPHHRPFSDTPLPLEHFLGAHSWGDDGVQANVLLPNPFESYDLYVTWQSGVWNGRELHLHDALTSGGAGYGEALLPFRGLIYQQRVYADFPLNEDMDASLGGCAFWDEYGGAQLFGADAGYHWQWPGAYRRTTVVGEVFLARAAPTDTDSIGYFAYAEQDLTRYVSAGVRYDWSEYADNDGEHAWLVTPYVTYHLTESFYLRASYRYRDLPEGKDDHAVLLNVVWGLGPHSHRVSD